jgi:hypothetical protein
MKKLLLIFAIFVGIIAYAQVPTTGLVDFYPFNGDANDASGNNLNGVNHGATLVSDRFGNPTAAYSFDPGNYIDCFDILDGTFAGAANKFTLSFWIKPSADNPNNMIIAKHSDGACSATDRQFFIRELNNMINVEYFGDNAGTNGRFICGSTALTTYTKWYHVVVIYDGSINTNNGLDRVRIYVDNKSEITTLACRTQNGTFPFDLTAGAAHFGIGNYLASSGTPCDIVRTYKGAIDDIRIYNRAVSTKEVEQLFYETFCFKTISVTDTLIINANITGFNPLTYKNTIKIYPNPAKDHLTLDFGDFSSLTGYSIRIDNSLGQKVFETPVNTKQSVIDIKSWTGMGLYFVYTIDEQGRTVDVKKIVLQ